MLHHQKCWDKLSSCRICGSKNYVRGGRGNADGYQKGGKAHNDLAKGMISGGSLGKKPRAAHAMVAA
jgi:hypothetical protein